MKNIMETVEHFKKDKLGNINLIYFIENNYSISIECTENSLLVRGKSDRPWVYIQCANNNELTAIKSKLDKQDKCFGAIEDWMFPLLIKDRELLWDLAMTQFYLPDNVSMPKSVHQTKSLSEKDAEFVYTNSEYKDHISVESIKRRKIHSVGNYG